MSSPHFTPLQAVGYRLSTRSSSLKELRVGQKVVIVWSQQWSTSIADALGATQVPSTMFEDAYWLRTVDTDSGGATVAFAPLGAPGTIMMMEDLIACGAKAIVGVGAAGALNPLHPVGNILIPERCVVIDEGTSAHYPLSGQPSVDTGLRQELISILGLHGARIATGKWWTTDGFYREMSGDITRHAKSGILGIDMETSAMYRVAQYRGVTACNMLVVSDGLWDGWHYGPGSNEFQNGVEAMLATAIGWASA